ncbi:MAG: hypothetical protein V8T51_08015 [Senegalimassilia faecalis]
MRATLRRRCRLLVCGIERIFDGPVDVLELFHRHNHHGSVTVLRQKHRAAFAPVSTSPYLLRKSEMGRIFMKRLLSKAYPIFIMSMGEEAVLRWQESWIPVASSDSPKFCGKNSGFL